MKNKFLIVISSFFLIPNLFAQCEPDIQPPVIATDSIIISCQLYDDETAPPPTVSDNCDNAPSLELINSSTDDDNACVDDNFPNGVIYITRTWEATDAAGNQSTAERVTAIVNATEFTFPTDVNWTPAQVDANPNVLFPSELTDDLTTTGSGIPNLDAFHCNYALSSDTDTVTTCSIGSMYLQRTWVVLNWCTNSLILEDSNGDDNVQNIFVGDPNTSPTASCIDTLNLEFFAQDNDGDGQIDACTLNLIAAQFNNGSSDNETPNEDLLFFFNNNPTENIAFFSGNNLGENNIVLYVQDAEGCTSTCSTILNLTAPLNVPCSETPVCEDGTPPTALCSSGLVVELIPTDTNGDGQIDYCFIELFASDFNAGSFDDTTAAEDLIFYFNSNPEDIVMQFSGSNIGSNNLTIYVGDADGCVSTCSTVLFIESSNPNCEAMLDYSLGGNVSTIQDQGIKDVEVNINGATFLTNVAGNYNYGVLDESGFTISCYKNNNPSNGVTAADLIIMRQHILTITPIENPVYLLAADVNNNGAITTADLVATRQVILGNATSFPNNTSWRFYYGDIETGEILETINVLSNLNSDLQVDWTGYKVGDVNGSADPE